MIKKSAFVMISLVFVNKVTSIMKKRSSAILKYPFVSKMIYKSLHIVQNVLKVMKQTLINNVFVVSKIAKNVIL